MSTLIRWIVDRGLLVPLGVAIVVAGAFIPWPSLAIAAVVIVLGGALMLAGIPVAFRAARTEQSPRSPRAPAEEPIAQPVATEAD